MLREPVERFLSEWRHVVGGATWFDRRLRCNNKRNRLPFCWQGKRNWVGVSLDEFLDCKYNLVKNRQTRMLADLRLVDCYNEFDVDNITKDKIMLQSAKNNLLKLPFFGLTNYQRLSQQLFEYTFRVKFNIVFRQNNHTAASHANFSANHLERIKYQTRLDIELYQYAKDIFMKRISQMEFAQT